MLKNEQVKHVAKLARIDLKEEEVERFRGQLSEVLNYMNILNDADIEELEETNQVTGLENVMEEDELFPAPCSREDLLKCSELPLDGKQIRVKKIVK